MKKLLLTLSALAILGVAGCTDNTMARNFGGTMKVELKDGARLINCTWKSPDNSLWVLTKIDPSQPPTTYKFEEISRYGIVEGKVIIIER